MCPFSARILLAALAIFAPRTAAGQAGVEQFPAYAPDLNPSKQVGQLLNSSTSSCATSLACGSASFPGIYLHRAIMRLRSKPTLIRSFSAGAGLSREWV